MTAETDRDDQPARLFLPPRLRPPAPLSYRQRRVFLLVGLAALFAGYDMNIYGFAIPQIQASLNIPEDQIGLTVSYFRLAGLLAVVLALSADLIGRRRLLLFTILGQAIATLATGFAQTYPQFVGLQIATRVFGYAEEMLCVVVIVEEVPAVARGWANGTLAAMSNTGAGIASIVFAFVTLLPWHWRALYVIGAVPLFLVGYLRRRLPETHRFEVRSEEVRELASRTSAALDLIRRLTLEHPGRLAAMLLAVSSWGFAVAPAAVLGNKYLQQTLGYAPYQTTLLLVPGGFVALVLNILAGRLSDKIGRKSVVVATTLLAGISYAAFYSGVTGWLIPPLWVVAFFSLFTTDALLAGYATEIFPTAYRATISGLRYTIGTLGGALSLWLEGLLYDRLHTHGAAVSVSLAAVLITAAMILFLPEPAGRQLEEISEGPEPVSSPVET